MVNQSINLGTKNVQIIDLALKVRSCDVISTTHCLNRQKKWRSCDVIKAPWVQTWFVYFFWNAQPHSINFVSSVSKKTDNDHSLSHLDQLHDIRVLHYDNT